MSVDVVYEDENIVAVNKPAGLLTHPVKRGRAAQKEETLADWLLESYPEVASVGDNPEMRPGIVHRLDRDTSGVLVVAKNQETFEYLKKLFQTRDVAKTYRAIVRGAVKDKTGVIDKPISIKDGSVKRTVFKGKREKGAVTEYRVLKNYDEYSYTELYPKTGRTHQLRVHMASIHHPVVGDTLYGRKDDKYEGRQLLHAYSIELTLPEGVRVKLTADLPEDFRAFLGTLENS